MAGMPGRSGGPRANSGGARPGAGRKPKPPAVAGASHPVGDPFDYLMSVVNDPGADAALRVRAAVAAVQYVHAKKGEGGKREEAQNAAQRAASKFKPSAPPLKLVSRT